MSFVEFVYRLCIVVLYFGVREFFFKFCNKLVCIVVVVVVVVVMMVEFDVNVKIVLFIILFEVMFVKV